MLEKYNQGKITGQKVDQYLVSAEMHSSGNFKRENFFLSRKQIASYFQDHARMRKKKRRATIRLRKLKKTMMQLKLALLNCLHDLHVLLCLVTENESNQISFSKCAM